MCQSLATPTVSRGGIIFDNSDDDDIEVHKHGHGGPKSVYSRGTTYHKKELTAKTSVGLRF